MSVSKMCESSLKWIMNMHSAFRIIQYNHIKDAVKLNEINGIKFGVLKIEKVKWFNDELNKYINVDGHSCGTFYWTHDQVLSIEKIGIVKWLQTPNVQGYSHYLINGDYNFKIKKKI